MAPRLLPPSYSPSFLHMRRPGLRWARPGLLVFGVPPAIRLPARALHRLPGRLDEWNERVATLANYALTSREAGSILPAGFRSRASAGQDEGPVVEAVRAVIARRGVQARQVITAVPGPAVMVKKVVLQAQTGAAIESAVLAEAGHLIPDSLDNVNLDYQVIDWIESGNKMEVLVVAVKKDIINSYTNAIRA